MSTIDGSMRIPEKVIQPAVEKKSESLKETRSHPKSEDKVTLGEKVAGMAEEAVGFAIAAPIAFAALPVGLAANAIEGGARGAIKALGVKNKFPNKDVSELAALVGTTVAARVLYGPIGWLAGVIGKTAWELQGSKIREAVNENVDKATKIFESNKPDKRSTIHKASDAALGYIVGSIRGGETGAEKYIDGSLKLGEKIASKIFKGK